MTNHKQFAFQDVEVFHSGPHLVEGYLRRRHTCLLASVGENQVAERHHEFPLVGELQPGEPCRVVGVGSAENGGYVMVNVRD